MESYLGLVASENTTGGRRRLGAISKKGNGYLRKLLVQAAWSLWRSADRADPLRQWTDAVAKRRPPGQRGPAGRRQFWTTSTWRWWSRPCGSWG